MQKEVSVARCDTYDSETVKQALGEVLRPVGGLDFVKPGMKVAVKINMVTGKNPDTAVTTNPVLVAELCRMLTEKGARVIVGDSPGGPFRAPLLKGMYRNSGLQIAEDAGAVLNEDVSVADAAFTDAVSMKTFTYTSWIDKADCIINFCKLKSHGMMNMTAAVKNMFGVIPGVTKPEYHMRFPDHAAFANMLVDIQEYFRPVLHIVDAVDCMEGNGPTAGTPRHMGLLLASRKPYDLDLVCAHLIGLDVKDVPTLQAAVKRGLSAGDYSEVKTYITGVDPEGYVIPDFRRADSKLDITFISFGPAQRLVTGITRTLLSTQPKVNKKECIGCRKCYDVCPAKAITMKNKKPKIDRSKCIRCFCCQEFCPAGAMKASHGGFFAPRKIGPGN